MAAITVSDVARSLATQLSGVLFPGDLEVDKSADQYVEQMFSDANSDLGKYLQAHGSKPVGFDTEAIELLIADTAGTLAAEKMSHPVSVLLKYRGLIEVTDYHTGITPLFVAWVMAGSEFIKNSSTLSKLVRA